MRALVASKYGPPSSYEISDLPIPEIRDPHDVLLRMEAVSISTSDTQLAAGMFRLFGTPRYGCIPLPSQGLPAHGRSATSSVAVRPQTAVLNFACERKTK